MQGAKSFLCLLINSLGIAGFQLFCSPFGQLPLTLGALSPCEVSLSGGLGPRQASCRPPFALLVQSFLSGVMVQLLLEVCTVVAWELLETIGKHCLRPQSDQGYFSLGILVASDWGGGGTLGGGGVTQAFSWALRRQLLSDQVHEWGVLWTPLPYSLDSFPQGNCSGRPGFSKQLREGEASKSRRAWVQIHL